ncbi:MAG TPA: penicillin-binding protein 2 [Ornithinimicrobium sp.]|uniref:peptidoglycan D,D-transpeptidase FtsI family protein n=1 Tax=Ornithinimicrobium sp. TaxID=1977084 RepID=UPI002B46A2B7|nr:penicillin-binding protein 2 [Ornithinimicrobium sp.]HKJ11954.1 penicillin-binding protein 2 [Ornithinimicrobium sp.]
MALTPRSSNGIGHGRGVAHPQRRAWVLLLGVLMVFSLFGAQLVRLQGLDAASVSAAAVDDRLREVTIPAPRGAITDVDGEPMALDIERKHITADPVNVAGYRRVEDGEVVSEGLVGAADDIAALTGSDAAELRQVLRDTTGRWTYLVKDVSPQTWQEVDDLGIPGVDAEDYHKRQYPLGEAPAPLLGWVGAGDQPAGGLERTQNEALTGTPGERSYELGGQGEIITTGTSVDTPAVPGQDIRLSVDSDLQWYAYDALEERVRQAGGLSGYVLVQEVKTGRLVAAASYPSFDPSEDTQDADAMRNLLVEDVFEPGSTTKLITAAAALEEGLVEADTPIVVPTHLPRAGKVFKDAKPHPVLNLTFAGVLATSSNMGTILFGEQLDEETLHDYLARFGMGRRSGLGLPGESSGVLPPTEEWGPTTQYTLMFGQGMSSTALQQLSVFQTIANDGVHVPPSVVEGTTDSQGRYAEAEAPQSERIVSSKTARTLTSIMEEVTSEEGTAPMAAVDGYRVSGKTSTASRFDDSLGRYSKTTASFVGYAPSEDPEYVVAVTVQRPTNISIYGGTIAGPVFTNVMRYVLQSNGVPPSEGEHERMDLEFDPGAPAPGKEQGVTLSDVAIKDEGSGG